MCFSQHAFPYCINTILEKDFRSLIKEKKKLTFFFLFSLRSSLTPFSTLVIKILLEIKPGQLIHELHFSRFRFDQLLINVPLLLISRRR